MNSTPHEKNHIPHISLIGDAEENFYQLGLKDRENFFSVYDHIREIFRPNLPLIGNILEATVEEIFKRNALPFAGLSPLIDSYAKGLNFPAHQIQLSLLLPELMSSLHAWLPGIKNYLLGCSSLFMLDEKDGELIHGRILDFPLQGSYDQFERVVSYNLSNQNQVFSYGAAGIPFASVTSMNDKGLTLALHQKFTNVFNKNGESIFEIAHQIISQASNKKEVFELLEGMESITAWNLNIGLPNQEVLEIDFLGDHFLYTEHKLELGEILYINNSLLERESSYQNYIPYGLDYYNHSREKAADQLVKDLRNKKHNSKNLITQMATHPFKTQKGSHPILTPSSVLVSTMKPSTAESLFVAGPAPKEINQGLISFTNIWSDFTQAPLKTQTKYTAKQQEILIGKRLLMQSQVDFDLKNFNDCYHHIQMAIDYLDGSSLKVIAQFYFYIFQTMLEKDRRVLSYLLGKLRHIKNELPGILDQHALLFIFRIERILSGKYSIKAKDFHHKKLQEIYNLECKVPQFMLQNIMKNATLPRIDLLDIIYLYGKL